MLVRKPRKKQQVDWLGRRRDVLSHVYSCHDRKVATKVVVVLNARCQLRYCQEYTGSVTGTVNRTKQCLVGREPDGAFWGPRPNASRKSFTTDMMHTLAAVG